MTFQELIKCHPWVDLAWEIFKGVSPTFIALFTIFVTEIFVRKRNNDYKMREMTLQYLEKILLWIHETRESIFDISKSLNKVLSMKNPPDRVPKFNEVLGQITEMNRSVFVLSDTYQDISSSMGYNFKLDQFRDSINHYSKTIDDIGVKYLNSMTTEKVAEEINFITVDTSEEIKESTSLLVKEISLLYEKKKKAIKVPWRE